MKRHVLVLAASYLFIFSFAASAAAASSDMSASSPMGSSSEPQNMEDFNIAGYGTKGEKTWEVKGATMEMAGNDVKMNDITAHLYSSEKNKENMTLTADHGRLDKQAGVVHLEDNVRAVTETGAQLDTKTLDWSQKDRVISSSDKVNLTRDNMTAAGTGMEAQPDMKTARLEKDVVMTVNGDKKAKGKDSGAGLKMGKMTITCDGPMEMDYTKQIAIFHKNVIMEGDADQGTMVADTLTITFNQKTKTIEKMDAEGHVKITRGENTSYSDAAVFTGADKRFVLTGRPKLILFTEGDFNVSP